jgi:hypothetical protein
MLAHSEIVVRAPDGDGLRRCTLYYVGSWKCAPTALHIREDAVPTLTLDCLDGVSELLLVCHQKVSAPKKHSVHYFRTFMTWLNSECQCSFVARTRIPSLPAARFAIFLLACCFIGLLAYPGWTDLSRLKVPSFQSYGTARLATLIKRKPGTPTASMRQSALITDFRELSRRHVDMEMVAVIGVGLRPKRRPE